MANRGRSTHAAAAAWLAVALVASPGSARALEPGWGTIAAVVSGETAPPAGWRLQRAVAPPAAQREEIARRLGRPLDGLANALFRVGDDALQVNLLECRTEADAAAVRARLVELHGGDPAAVLGAGRRVVEFARTTPRTAYRAAYDLELAPRRVVYRVRFDAAPLERADDARWQSLFDAFRRCAPGCDSADRAALVREAAPFRFGRVLRLRRLGQGPLPNVLLPTPRPSDPRPAGAGDVVEFAFDSLPGRGGIGVVGVTATVTSEAFSVTPGPAKPTPALLAPTPRWPSADSAWAARARDLTAGREGVRAKAEALLAWLEPGRHLRYGGARIGSRDGVARTMERGEGHCWEFADVFVTLARAAGVPSRQVLGWLAGREGHVWVEVLLEGGGWLALDPTAGRGCGSDYVPLFVSEDGDVPFVYASEVEVRATGGAGD